MWRGKDSEKSSWWRGSMKCHIVLPEQHYMHGGKKKKQEEKSHYSAPLSHGLTLVLTSLLESGFINHRYRGAFECIVWFSLTGGQLSQDVCPPVPISLTQRKLIHRSGIWSVCTLIPMLKPHVPPKRPLISKHDTYLFCITTSEND